MREGKDRQFAFILWPDPFITHTGHLETSATSRSMAQAGLYAVFFCMLGEYTAKSEARLLTRKIPEAGTTWDISFGNRVGSRTRVQEGYPGFDVGEKIWCVCFFFSFTGGGWWYGGATKPVQNTQECVPELTPGWRNGVALFSFLPILLGSLPFQFVINWVTVLRAKRYTEGIMQLFSCE